MEPISENRCFGGVQGVYRHASAATGTAMTFAAFVPDHAPGTRLPVLWYLSGLTCTHANVMDKGGYRQACAEAGIIFIAPDTSPRGPDLSGNDVADDPAYDMGQGAGFYVDAEQAPWRPHFRMRSYIEQDLPALIADQFPMADMARQGITGHSMGGHGALTIALRNPGTYRSVSAFAPIVCPMVVPWGQKAFTQYLGDNAEAWMAYDAVALIDNGARVAEVLVDQGAADQFLDEQLKPHLLAEACTRAGIPLTLRMQPGYDHSYYFIQTFMADHIRWHAERLA